MQAGAAQHLLSSLGASLDLGVKEVHANLASHKLRERAQQGLGEQFSELPQGRLFITRPEESYPARPVREPADVVRGILAPDEGGRIERLLAESVVAFTGGSERLLSTRTRLLDSLKGIGVPSDIRDEVMRRAMQLWSTQRTDMSQGGHMKHLLFATSLTPAKPQVRLVVQRDIKPANVPKLVLRKSALSKSTLAIPLVREPMRLEW